MADIRLTVDGSPHVVAAGTTAGTVFYELGIDAVVARANDGAPEGILRDLAWVPDDGDVIESVPIDTDEGRAVLRHSTAHVLAQAVQQLFPDAKLGIGPPITNGFYDDFDVDKPFTPDDLEQIEDRMRKIMKEKQRFARRVVTDDDARAELKDEPYKLELIGLKGSAGSAAEGADVEVGGGELTIYDNLRRDELVWKDLCRGPHLPTTGKIPAFTLMRSAAAYWRGSEKNPQLQRIYGTAWESQEALDAHLHRLPPARRGGPPPPRVGEPGGTRRAPAPARRGRAARPPPSRRGARPVLVPRRDRLGARGVPPQGRGRPQGARGLQPPPPRGGRLRVRQHPPHHQGAAVRDLRAPGLVRGGHVPAHAARRRAERRRDRPQAGAGLLPQADELPHAQPDLPLARAQLPGAAAAA